MKEIKHTPPALTLTEADQQKHDYKQGPVHPGFILWFLGLAILLGASWLVRSHAAPWPFELAFSRDIQSWSLPGWLTATFTAITTFNDPIPSGFVAAILIAFMLFKRWTRPALFLGYLVLVANSIDAIIGDIVGRPRPSPHIIHVSSQLAFNSFPSGHTEHIVIFYGFLLFLTLLKPVRSWKYAKWLLPLQVLMALDILIIGFARVLEGEHWVTDVLGGYLSGVLWLTLFIYLYGCQWTRNEAGAWEKGRRTEKNVRA
ncbi:MAG TPA: phosphatase PAP2 family protein [Ktedonobacteraceae bacterium]|nr:phosphatase PAP2 family protein [Ktedonobacteraceae bacterium]